MSGLMPFVWLGFNTTEDEAHVEALIKEVADDGCRSSCPSRNGVLNIEDPGYPLGARGADAELQAKCNACPSSTYS